MGVFCWEKNKMDTLAPPFRALLQIKFKIQTGSSTRESIREYTKEFVDCEFSKKLDSWLFSLESQGQSDDSIFKTSHQKMLIEVLARGLEGDEILQSIKVLEEEMLEFSHLELDKQLKTLPLKTMVPLLLFQLPAFLLLFFGPFLINLLSNFS